MTKTVIAIDAMGGDFGPAVTIDGLARIHKARPHASYLLFGNEDQISTELKKHAALSEVSRIIHCDVDVPMDAKPSVALRQGRKVSGMWKAIHAVKEGEAQACVSAGNTGALMAMSKVILRTQPGIERPAIACIWPTVRGESVVLDVGANIGGMASQYVQFAAMGAAYARTVFGLKKPDIGLLNIGTEEMKGTDEVKEAAELLERSELNFKGFVEGDGIGRGDVDVVVTDGAEPVTWWIDGALGSLAALRPPQVVDTTGAGDAFTAGLLHRWVTPVPERLRFAAACGALVCVGAGAIDPQPTEAEVVLFGGIS